MAKSIWMFLLTAILHDYCFSQCSKISFDEGVRKKLITADLFSTSIDSNWMACPNFSIGDSTLCGTVRHGRDDQWDPDLPDGLLFSIFFERKEYSLIKNIFTDPFFIESLRNIPDPSEEALKWFEWRNIAHTIILIDTGESDESQSRDEDTLDWIQKKMVSVFYSVRTWTFCPEKVMDGRSTVHGLCDKGNNIIIYNTACRVGKVYETEINSTALMFRMFFVCAHELAHVIDRLNGSLSVGESGKFERRANVNGLIMTKALSELVTKSLFIWQDLIKRNQHLASPCDAIFIQRTVQKWEGMPKYFESRTQTAKDVLKRGQSERAAIRKNKEWTIWACLERAQKIQ